MEASSKVIQNLRDENLKLSQRLKHSMSNGKNVKMTNLKLEEIQNNNLSLKKAFSNRNIKKNYFSIYKEIPIISKEILHIIDKYTLHKLKLT